MNIPPPIGAPPTPTPAPPAASTAPELPDMRLVIRAYRQLRDAVDELKAKHALELKPYQERMAKLELVSLAYLNSSGANSIKTGDGTAYLAERVSVSVADAEEFEAFAADNPDLREVRASKSAVSQYVKEHGQVPPGIKISREATVNFRK